MKALVFYEHGGSENVQFADIPEPEIGPYDALLSVHAAAFNRLDLWVVEGWPGLKLKFPHVMGSDGAGVVAAVGSSVRGIEVGQRVAVNPTICGNPQEDYFGRTGRDNMCDDYTLLGEHLDGFFAEYTAVPARNLLPLPDRVSFADAAAASLVFVTAWHSLIVRGGLQAGESVLIVGAGGGVNTASIQIAKMAGAGPIYVVGSSEEKLQLARDLGADETINRQETDWGKAVFKATNRRGVDVVVDNVGAATYHTSLRSLKKGGRLLTVGNSSGPKFEFDNRLMFGKHLSIIGSTMGTTAEYEKVMGLIFDGHLRPIIDTVYPFEEGLAALNRLQEGDLMGKLVLQMNNGH